MTGPPSRESGQNQQSVAHRPMGVGEGRKGIPGVQWLRTHFPMQGALVQSLGREDLESHIPPCC